MTADLVCPDCSGEDFRGEGEAQVCRECGLAIYPDEGEPINDPERDEHG